MLGVLIVSALASSQSFYGELGKHLRTRSLCIHSYVEINLCGCHSALISSCEWDKNGTDDACFGAEAGGNIEREIAARPQVILLQTKSVI